MHFHGWHHNTTRSLLRLLHTLGKFIIKNITVFVLANRICLRPMNSVCTRRILVEVAFERQRTLLLWYLKNTSRI